MFGLSNFEIGFLVVCVLIVLKIYSFYRKGRKQDTYDRKKETLKDAEYKRSLQIRRVEIRRDLRHERTMHLQRIQEENREFKERKGYLAVNEEEEMRKYDKLVKSRWDEVGMIPPSYTRDGKVGYVNPKQAELEEKIWIQREVAMEKLRK